MTKKSEQKKPDEQTPITWEVAEFEYVEKTKDWYWTVGIIGLACAGAAFLAGVWTLTILIVVSTFLLGYMAAHKPAMLQVSIDHKHLLVNERKYNTKELESYYIDQDSNKLLLKYTSNLKPLIITPLPEEFIEDDLETLLSETLKLEEDDELTEPWIEVVMHKLGF